MGGCHCSCCDEWACNCEDPRDEELAKLRERVAEYREHRDELANKLGYVQMAISDLHVKLTEAEKTLEALKAVRREEQHGVRQMEEWKARAESAERELDEARKSSGTWGEIEILCSKIRQLETDLATSQARVVELERQRDGWKKAYSGTTDESVLRAESAERERDSYAEALDSVRAALGQETTHYLVIANDVATLRADLATSQARVKELEDWRTIALATTGSPGEEKEINQCDGCRRGLPRDSVTGDHHGADTYDAIACTAHLYRPVADRWQLTCVNCITCPTCNGTGTAKKDPTP